MPACYKGPVPVLSESAVSGPCVYEEPTFLGESWGMVRKGFLQEGRSELLLEVGRHRPSKGGHSSLEDQGTHRPRQSMRCPRHGCGRDIWWTGGATGGAFQVGWFGFPQEHNRMITCNVSRGMKG